MDRPPQAASVAELMTAIVADTGELLSAHVTAVRIELTEGLRDVQDRTRSMIYVAAALIVAAVAINLALAASLLALGVPAWLAAWLVAALSTAVLLLLRRRRRAPASAKPGDGDPAAAIVRAGHDAAWLADRAADAIT